MAAETRTPTTDMARYCDDCGAEAVDVCPLCDKAVCEDCRELAIDCCYDEENGDPDAEH